MSHSISLSKALEICLARVSILLVLVSHEPRPSRLYTLRNRDYHLQGLDEQQHSVSRSETLLYRDATNSERRKGAEIPGKKSSRPVRSQIESSLEGNISTGDIPHSAPTGNSNTKDKYIFIGPSALGSLPTLNRRPEKPAQLRGLYQPRTPYLGPVLP